MPLITVFDETGGRMEESGEIIKVQFATFIKHISKDIIHEFHEMATINFVKYPMENTFKFMYMLKFLYSSVLYY
jgi:hypothetical protein